VLANDSIKGLKIDTEETASGVRVNLTVEKGARIARPVHLCFGLLPKEGLQEILMKVDARDDSDISVIAHCVFPNAVKVIHKMDADINIGANARFDYKETHYHGENGGIEVIPRTKVRVGKGGVWQSTFALSQGLVGKLDYDSEVFCQEKAVAELVVKVYGKGSDDIKIVEKIYLEGKGARGMAKSRLVLSDKARAEVRGETYGNAPYARGHVDCMELVNGTEVIAVAIPVVSVTDGTAKVTHEAAIGSIDRKQVETLMARGLDENEAVDVIVRGILK
jgi:Fe-S cluster assembly scaffold protein SufB